MAQIQVYDGTYMHQPIGFDPKTRTLYVPPEKSLFGAGLSISIEEIEMIEIATEENVKRTNPAWDLDEAKHCMPSTPKQVMFGLFAVVTEMVTKGMPVTFIVKFPNRRAILATTNEDTFNQLRAPMQK